jgi:hypothetical protein
VDRLDPRLLDLQTGESTQFGTEMIPVVGRPAFAFTFPATQLIAGHKYRLAIRAVDTQNQFVRRQTQSASSSEDTTVWATQDFAYNPPQPTSLSFAIDGVDADFVSRTVTISINHSDTAQRLTYEGVIANRAGAVVGHLQPMLLDLTSSVVSVPMPDAMANAQGETEYHLIFRLYDADDRKLITEQSRDFTVAPPPAPGLPQRLAGAFLSVAWLRWSLLGIGATSALIVVLARWPRPKRPLPRPRDAMHV